MIYRILTNDNEYLRYDEERGEWVVRERLFGAAIALSDAMWDVGLPAPRRLTNGKTRFYFTERGWRLYGRHIAAEGRRRGHVLKVIRRKNPPPSQVVYEDDVQMAILTHNTPGRRVERTSATDEG